MSAVELRDCIEELLSFTLQSYVNDTLEFDLRLSKCFCSQLLSPEPSDQFPLPPDFNESLEGVPLYPLYKRLALALLESMTSGTFHRTYNKMTLISVEESLKQKESEWQKLILEKASEIVNILRTVDFELDVQEPFFSQLKDGKKTIEGRCAVGKYTRIGSGTLLLLNKCIVLQVQVPMCVQIYRKFYTEEKERLNGVLAISISKAALQPCISMASMFSALNYEGLQGLLGLTSTKGTIESALPPPRSILFSSFMLPHKPVVTSSTLTHGARALAKHVHRSSDKFWGAFVGSDSNKNKLALDVIIHLVTNCCWLNVHIVPPHGEVFEIRVADGYGARWSKDGSQVNEVSLFMESPLQIHWEATCRILRYLKVYWIFGAIYGRRSLNGMGALNLVRAMLSAIF
ncbi:uncharacterized protein LOC107422004 isoform X2 [Ziziphus jujuba]|uniref:Uncharacterized protein LOC107422004 isoform X2 n=1 Tax=Ziziphus jujuba TaxID=326968 RepID=A0ABM3IPH7_ZIZJJ|nr:uncharacterized protein LOC107422004 isoform X2 [Ziziphus jujuba]